MNATTNFTNGSLVLRVWRFDGGTEVMAKFQYYGMAKAWCASLPYDASYFHIAVCDHENEARAFGIKEAALATAGA
jgi:hypothetical protein